MENKKITELKDWLEGINVDLLDCGHKMTDLTATIKSLEEKRNEIQKKIITELKKGEE